MRCKVTKKIQYTQIFFTIEPSPLYSNQPCKKYNVQ